MATQHARLLSRVIQRRTASLTYMSQRWYKKEGETGTPYRPWPMEKYFWQGSAEHWTKDYPAQSANADEYEKEEVYLDEIEARMRKYDKKYSQADKAKNLFNEFGFENQDDRAFHTYGGGLSGENDELQYGRGKKLDPAQYVNSDFTPTTRKVIPPVEYLTGEQVRRSRGSLANFREVPPETASIWKYWNAYSAIGVFFMLCVSKEYFILGGHDMWDALMYWGIFGMAGSLFGDWIAWWHAIISQESYDREYFMLNDKLKGMNKEIEALASKPNERRLLLNMVAYRDVLAEKVLQKTLSNRVGRVLEKANRQLGDKFNEEQSLKKDAEYVWSKDAIEKTLLHFESDKVKNDFMNEAIKQFCAPNAASLKQSQSTVTMSSDLFKNKYDASHNDAKNKYLKEQKDAGTLSWVFVDQKERSKKHMSKKDKEAEFNKRIKSWEQSHNSVNAQIPSFA